RARKRAHHKPLDSAADFDFVAGSIAEIDARAQRHRLGDDELAAVSLGQTLDTACGVDGIADRGHRHRRAVTHLADDRWAGMNADTDAQRFGYVVDERVVEALHALRHVASGGERLAAARLDATIEAEQRHHAVADELVDAPARRFDRVASLGKVAIEEED